MFSSFVFFFFIRGFFFICGRNNILLLPVDIELNPGPTRQLCAVCNKAVNKRYLEECP